MYITLQLDCSITNRILNCKYTLPIYIKCKQYTVKVILSNLHGLKTTHQISTKTVAQFMMEMVGSMNRAVRECTSLMPPTTATKVASCFASFPIITYKSLLLVNLSTRS